MSDLGGESWTAENRLEPKFLTALGRFVATCGDLEDMLLTVAWRIRSTEQRPESEWDETEVRQVLERFEKALSDQLHARFELFKSSYQVRYNDWSESGLDVTAERVGKIRDFRNCVCHCSWQRTREPGHYRAKWISRRRADFAGCRTVLDDPISAEMLDQFSAAMEEEVQILANILGAKNIHPAQEESRS